MTWTRISLVGCGALLWILGSGTLGTAQPDSGPTKRALLIGINDYESDTVSDLTGCVNDIERMKILLQGKFGFDEVHLLADGEATRAGILQAIEERLIGPSRDGDIALLHYSGHGSRMRDKSGDELDGLDETIVPSDSRTDGVFDISDDEINALMTRLSEKTPHAVFILDSCHSGSASRAAEVGNTVRQTPADDREPPDVPSEPASRADLEGADDFRLPGAGYVLISGCRANELSNEATFGDRRHGALTHFLAQALTAAGDRVTYRDLMETVEANVTARFRRQHPQLEGTGVDHAVFGVEQILPTPYVLVDPAGAAEVKVEAGDLFGLAAGTTLQVHPPGTKDFSDPSAATATIRITEVRSLDSTASLVEGVVEPRSRAVLEAIRPPDFSVGVFFEPESPSALLEAVRVALAEHDSVQVVADRAAAQIRVAENDEEAWLEGTDLERLSTVRRSSATAVTDLVSAVAHWGRWFAILAIDNPSPDLAIELSIRRHPKPGPGEPEVRIEVVESGPVRGEMAPDAVPHDSRVRSPPATGPASRSTWFCWI